MLSAKGVRLPPTEQLLLEGGDARIELDPERGGASNKYGCSPLPDPGLLAFGSSTGTGISAAGFAAADQLRSRLIACGDEPHAVTYGRELSRIRQDLLGLCGASDIPGLEVVFAASGTDLHLIAAQLAGGTKAKPTLAIMVEAAETGSYVPAALAGHHFSSRATLGGSVSKGAAITGSGAIEVVTVPIRAADGSPRAAELIDAVFESHVVSAAEQGRRVLLILVDVSKTGMMAPSPALVSHLKRRFPDEMDVLIDACQFRLAPQTLHAYLAQEFMVALTGSKFVTGPTFAGALFIPAAAARRLRLRPLPNALLAYSTRADWPQGWEGCLDDVANFGLLLRWEAALQELHAFREVPEERIAGFLKAFGGAVEHRLSSDPSFAPLSVPPLDRSPWPACWDSLPTIFPFLIFHGGEPLSRDKTARVYRLLQEDLSHGFAESALAALRCQLGQPVACGVRVGIPVSALRLCASARLVVEATADAGRKEAAVIASALAALDKTALLASTM